MNTLDKLAILRGCGPFDRLSAAELAQVADSCEEKRYAPGQTIVHQGMQIAHVYVLFEGAASCGKQGLCGIIGAEGVFLHTVFRSHVVAGDSGAAALVIGRGRFFTIINECPAFTVALAKQFSETRELYVSLEVDA